ncbi:putative sporulation-specific glycosylase YdhD [Lachnospiraceae bacterium]|nr:putative sporulation-specific glycosylase YdhD [Lachnospiraceae bacterium]
MEEKDIKRRTVADRPSRNNLTGRSAGSRPTGSNPGSNPAAGRAAGSRPTGSNLTTGRAAGSRPTGNDPEGSNPTGSNPAAGDRPRGGRPAGNRPAGGRASGNRAAGSRPGRRTVSSGNRKQSARRPQSRRKRKRNMVLRTAFLIILLIAAVAGMILWKKYSPSREKADLKKYYGIEEEGQLAIIVNNEIVEANGMISDGKAYVRYETVRDHINNRFYWDPNENVLLYTLPKDMVSVEVGSKDYTISKDKQSENYVILKTEGSTAYIALDFIQQYTNMEYEVYDDPGRVMIVSDWGKTKVAQVKKNTQVRYRGGVKSPVLADVSKKDEVTIIESEANWKKIRTKDGFIGYIKSSALKNEETKTISRDFEEQEFTGIKKDYIINLAWHNVTNSKANSGVLQKIAETKGLTTIAPTWYHVKDIEGNLESISSSEYVNYAHQSNIEVWATVRDFDGGINSYDESFAFLSYTSRRENLINQLIAEALQTGIDGINVDFEKISEECGEHYIQFVRELSVRCRQNGLVLSVDNYVPKGYNQQYNRKEQGVVADYVIIMGYDEHYAGSPESGSVSSYNFVKEGIENTLKEVPAEKVISGIPFFTRLWEETPKTEAELAEEAGTDAAEYPVKVSSEALTMSSAAAKVSEAGAEITWDEDAQQNFATWTSGDKTYKIWLEDEKSLGPKLKLMKDNKLAGTAAWALGQEKQEIWQLILQYVN